MPSFGAGGFWLIRTLVMSVNAYVAVRPTKSWVLIGLLETNVTPSPYFVAASRISFSVNSSGAGALAAPSLPAWAPKPEAIAANCSAASAFIATDCSMVPLPSGLSLIIVDAVMQPEANTDTIATSERRAYLVMLTAPGEKPATSRERPLPFDDVKRFERVI